MNSEIQYPAEKIATAWGAWGITTWADASSVASFIAGMLAAIYTLTLMAEWWWKKFWRPLLRSHGLIAQAQIPARRHDDDDNE